MSIRPHPAHAVAAALLIAGLGTLAAPAAAQTVKPGLWELRQQPQLDPQRQAQLDQARRQMAALPPEQRQLIEQMMAQRGVSVDMGQGGAITLKSCVSKEQAERALMPGTTGQCQHQIKQDGKTLRGTFRCTDPASEGETELVFQGDERYTTKTEVRVQREGRTEVIRSSGDARWLGSDCGTLKPMPMDLPKP